MSKKIIKVNTDQGRYRVRRINYDRFDNMPSDSWDYEAEIGEAFLRGESTIKCARNYFYSQGKSFRVYARHGGTVANKYGYPARTSAVLAIECVDCGTTVVMGAQSPANKATRAGAAAACLAKALGTGWVGAKDGRWLWDKRASRQERKDKAWFTLARAHEILVARADGGAGASVWRKNK